MTKTAIKTAKQPSRTKNDETNIYIHIARQEKKYIFRRHNEFMDKVYIVTYILITRTKFGELRSQDENITNATTKNKYIFRSRFLKTTKTIF